MHFHLLLRFVSFFGGGGGGVACATSTFSRRSVHQTVNKRCGRKFDVQQLLLATQYDVVVPPFPNWKTKCKRKKKKKQATTATRIYRFIVHACVRVLVPDFPKNLPPRKLQKTTPRTSSRFRGSSVFHYIPPPPTPAFIAKSHTFSPFFFSLSPHTYLPLTKPLWSGRHFRIVSDVPNISHSRSFFLTFSLRFFLSCVSTRQKLYCGHAFFFFLHLRALLALPPHSRRRRDRGAGAAEG